MADYNLAVSLEPVKWNVLEEAVGTFNAARLILAAEPYTGQFIVDRQGNVSSGREDGLEIKIATLDMLAPGNIEALNSKGKEPVHAHLEGNHAVISYTLKQVKHYQEK